MRNLKKILAMVLALVMSLSLVTIANASDFTDSDDITYEEAADVMNAIGIIEGFEDGSFDPDGTLTREQAAALVTRMLLGDNADRLGIEESTFDDVAVTRWSAPYIEYCASLGLIDGAGDGNFYPAGQLTGYAFAKILLTAIGYSSEAEGLTGNSWSVNTSALAMDVGLHDGLENGISSAVLSREEAAQMALNAICTPLVAYDDGVTVIVDGTPVTVGSGDAYYITTTLAREQRIGKDTLSNTKEYTVEFGEKYFPDLRLVDDPDEFNRPCHTWVYENEEIGSYVDYNLLVETYTSSVTGKDLYDLIGRTTINSYDIVYYVDGAVREDVIKASNMIRTNDRTYTTTGNGVLTQVFVDHDANDGDGEITITSINTYLAKALADYNETRGTLSLKVYQGSTGYTLSSGTVDDVDFPNIVDYEQDDYMLVNLALGSNNRYDIVRVNDLDVMTDSTVTKFSRNSYLVTGGEQYNYAKQGRGGYSGTPAPNNDVLNELNQYDDNQLTNYTYNVYLDQYGYVIGTERYAGQANYLFLTGYDRPTSNLAIRTAEAGAIFLDGQFQRIQVNVTDTDDNIDELQTAHPSTGYTNFLSGGEPGYNMWFTYTTRQSGGETIYTLKPVENYLEVRKGEETSINSASVRLDGNTGDNHLGASGADNGKMLAFGNDDSVYLTVDAEDAAVDGIIGYDSAITKVNGIFTGVQDVDLKVDNTTSLDFNPDNRIFAVYDEDLYIIAAVVIGSNANNSDNYAYVLEDAKNEYVDEEGNYYWEFVAVVDGEIVTLTAKEDYDVFDVVNKIEDHIGSGVNGLMKLTYDADGYVVGAEAVSDTSTTDAVYGMNDHRAGADIDPDVHEVYSMGYTSGIRGFTVYGRTLYITNASGNETRGITIASDAPVIVMQDEKRTDSTIDADTYAAYSNLDQALDSMQNNGRGFTGYVSAVLNERGTAVFLVLSSNIPLDVETDDGSTPEPEFDVTINVITKTVDVELNGASKTWDEIAEYAMEALNAKFGYEFSDWNSSTQKLTVTNANGGSIVFTVTWH